MKVTEDVSRRLIRLPLYYGMENNEVDWVIKAMNAFLKQYTLPSLA
jgi:dTDP-4-amino-4,6-dideoxygalactose transaminase